MGYTDGIFRNETGGMGDHIAEISAREELAHKREEEERADMLNTTARLQALKNLGEQGILRARPEDLQ